MEVSAVKRNIIGLLLGTIVMMLVVIISIKQLTTPNMLSKDEITEQIEKSYHGDVLTIVEK